MAALASMCGLACDAAMPSTSTSSLHARRFTRLISLYDFRQQQQQHLNHAAAPLMPQPPPAAAPQHHGWHRSLQQPRFGAAAMPQLAPDLRDATDAAPSRRRSRSGDALQSGSSTGTTAVDRLQRLAYEGVETAAGDDATASWERQPDRRKRPPGASRTGSRRSSKRRKGSGPQQSGPADRQQPPVALKPGKDPHAIRSPSLISNSDIPNPAWAVMRTLKESGEWQFSVALMPNELGAEGAPMLPHLQLSHASKRWCI